MAGCKVHKLLQLFYKLAFLSSQRFDASTNELVSDKIGVAYPVKNGIPYLSPRNGRLLKKDSTTSTNNEQQSWWHTCIDRLTSLKQKVCTCWQRNICLLMTTFTVKKNCHDFCQWKKKTEMFQHIGNKLSAHFKMPVGSHLSLGKR